MIEGSATLTKSAHQYSKCTNSTTVPLINTRIMESHCKISSKDDFDMKKQVGEGAYGKVYLATRKSDGQDVAIKVVNIAKMDRLLIQHTLNEIRILGSLSSEFIVNYYEAFLDSSEKYLWMVMEYMGGGDLTRALEILRKSGERFPEGVIWRYFIQILKGLAHLNKHHIIHRDIKPANLFLAADLNTIKIGDLNISKVIKDDMATTQIGSPSYLAPEVWEGRPYDAVCDIWSLGCCIYEMATLNLPFQARALSELKQKIKGQPVPPINENYSSDLKSIILKCLNKAPGARPTAEMLLNNPIVKSRVNEIGLLEPEEQGKGLMATIFLPTDLKTLNQKLPKKERSDSLKKLVESQSGINIQNTHSSNNQSNTPSPNNTHSKLNATGNSNNTMSHTGKNLNTSYRHSDVGERRSTLVANPQLPIIQKADDKKLVSAKPNPTTVNKPATPVSNGKINTPAQRLTANPAKPGIPVLYKPTTSERKSTPVISSKNFVPSAKVINPQTPVLNKSVNSNPAIKNATPINRNPSNSKISQKPETPTMGSRRDNIQPLTRNASRDSIKKEVPGSKVDKTFEKRLTTKSENSDINPSFPKPPLKARTPPLKSNQNNGFSPSPQPASIQNVLNKSSNSKANSMSKLRPNGSVKSITPRNDSKDSVRKFSSIYNSSSKASLQKVSSSRDTLIGLIKK